MTTSSGTREKTRKPRSRDDARVTGNEKSERRGGIWRHISPRKALFLRFTIPAVTRGGQVRESASVVWVVGFDNRARLASMRESGFVAISQLLSYQK